ncbi:MAG: ABC transporter ATP-binding protein, partial [Peptococcaceae bacterium]
MILEVKNLKFSYHKKKPVFADVNFTLNQGETLTILGPNGAGKSTLLNCLANVLTPTGGDIFLEGKNIRETSLRDVARILGYVPQSHTPAYGYSVRDFVVMGRAPYLGMFQKPGRDDYALADRVIAQMNLTKLADQPYTEISGGERQQAAIARAI